MPRTPDAKAGVLYEEAIAWTEQTSDPSEEARTQFVQDKGLLTYCDGAARSIGETRAAVWQPPVDDIANDPPASPSSGDRVLVGGTPTGDFVGHAWEIAQWDGSDWVFTEPKEGTITYVTDEDEPYKQTAAAGPWVWTELVGASSGVTEGDHKVLRHLIHFLSNGPGDGFDSGAYRETLPSGSPFPTSVIWWESSSKTKKIVERTITWSGATATSDEWKIYDTDGTTLLATVTDAISYSGVFETSRTRTIVVS
jgi:hypothetical protein